MEYYSRLRDLREDADLTQKQVGKLLQTTQQQYAKYELGVQEMPTHHIITLADYYNVSVDYLVGRSEWEDVLLYRFCRNADSEKKTALYKILSKTDAENAAT